MRWLAGGRSERGNLEGGDGENGRDNVWWSRQEAVLWLSGGRTGEWADGHGSLRAGGRTEGRAGGQAEGRVDERAGSHNDWQTMCSRGAESNDDRRVGGPFKQISSKELHFRRCGTTSVNEQRRDGVDHEEVVPGAEKPFFQCRQLRRTRSTVRPA